VNCLLVWVCEKRATATTDETDIESSRRSHTN